MGRNARRLALAIALALLGACGRDDDQGERAPAAGEPAAAPQPTGEPLEIAPDARVAVGVLQGDPMRMLDQVRTPFLLPDGSLVVPNAGSSTIRVFGPDGAFLREIGGRGEGPGELSALTSAWARGTVIEAWDGALQRITRFLPGDSVETVRVRLEDVSADQVLGALGAGWALTTLRAQYGQRDRAAVLAVSDSGRLVSTVTELPGMVRFQAPHTSGPHPLSPTALFAVHDDLVYAAETLTPTIGVYDAQGTHVRDIAVPLTAPRAPATVLRDVIDAAVARAPEEEQEMIRQRWSAYPELERLSVFWEFIVDELGFIWIRPYDPFEHALALDGRPSGDPGPGGEWVVLSPDGVEIARVRAPDGLALEYVGARAVVGIARDRLGVESVRVHALTRR